MRPKKDRGSRTETLSLRLDPKTKFILEFVARINGQTLTTIVDRAIRASCDQVRIGGDEMGDGFNWQHFWDPDEGVRILKLLACDHYPSTYDEDDLRQFTQEHWEFFYTARDASHPMRGYIQILWPKIEEYRRMWLEQRDTDYWAAGKSMAGDLAAAQLKPPAWPRPSKPTAPASTKTAPKRDDLDDEIPF